MRVCVKNLLLGFLSLTTSILPCATASPQDENPQQETELSTFLRETQQLISTPKIPLIAVLGEDKANLWEKIVNAARFQGSLAPVVQQLKLLHKEVETDGQKVAVVIDDEVLDTKLSYEVAVLESVLTLLNRQQFVTLGQLRETSPDLFHKYATWLELYAPYRLPLARFANPKYQEVIISPIGLIYLDIEAGAERTSAYVGDVQVLGASEIEIFGRQNRLYQPELASEILARGEETLKRIDEVNSFYARGSKMTVFWTSHNLETETVHEVVSKAISSAVQERNRKLGEQASMLKSKIADAISILFVNTYGMAPNREVDILEAGRVLQVDVSSLLDNLGIPYYTGRAVVRVVPGVVIGVLNKFFGTYNFAKIDLISFATVNVGSIDVRSVPEKVMDLRLR